MDGFPPISVLDEMPDEAAAEALRTLFEDAPRFLRRLAAARPFRDDDGLIRAARAVVEAATEEERVELINAHPRIGAMPGAMSTFSRREQGLDGAGLPDPTPEVQGRLDELNERYEERFGFPFVVFVAGRPRSEIVLLMEAALGAERDAELERAVADTVAIAADRLATLRGRAARGPTIRA